jgi:hypothetical protein
LNTSNYVRARQRLPLSIIRELTAEVATGLQKDSPWNWRGRQVKLIDGSTIQAADTHANRRVFPPHGLQAKDIGFPILRVCALICLHTASVCDFEMAPYRGKRTGEQTLARHLLRSMVNEDILLGDALMDTYYFLADVKKAGSDALFEAKCQRKVNFPKGRSDVQVELKRPYYASILKMSREEHRDYPKTLTVRYIKDGSRILVTTLLDSKKYPRAELRKLYLRRWNIELDLRNIKDVMGMDLLRGQTPAMLEKEIWATLLAYNLIRHTMAEAAVRNAADPRELSFSAATQAINTFVPLIQMARGQKQTDLRERMYQVIAATRVGRRPGRREPRAIKRRPKHYALLKISRRKWKKEHPS